MKFRLLIAGLLTHIPIFKKHFVKEPGGSVSARYCYSVWLRHLVLADKNGLRTHPKTIAELGPGDSLGTGLAALISGVEEYYAFDIVEYANIQRNLEIFDELITLFKNKEDIPDEKEFPKVKPYLDNYTFPSHLFTDEHLKKALDNKRLDKIKNSVLNPNDETSIITYKVPWYNSDILKPESIDIIFSQAVLEHVDDLKYTYATMREWLKPNGFISHQIDFKSHGYANEWNGHWTYSDFLWKLIRGIRPYLINREPHSTHIEILKEVGFEIVCDQVIKSKSTITREKLARKFKNISDDDLIISGAFIQAKK